MKMLMFFLTVLMICSCSELKIIEPDNELYNDNSVNDDTTSDGTLKNDFDNEVFDKDNVQDESEVEDADKSEESDADCTKADLNENEKQAVSQIFEEFDLACRKTASEGSYLTIYHENELKGFAIASSNYGFDGPVEMMTGIDKDGKILAVSEVSQWESWWFRLGSWFFDQFKNVEISKISLDPRYDKNCWPCIEMYDSFSPYEVDAVSGATYSSNAVTKDVWDAIYIYDKLP